jgi:hypothetical protein
MARLTQKKLDDMFMRLDFDMNLRLDFLEEKVILESEEARVESFEALLEEYKNNDVK